ncbi:lipase chaperone [Streptomyces flavochromogenes]|uniref:Lipase chaperone n=1 Tax=Streptomyces flavochromogenes TaxID=68199 RepID=A0ABW6XNP9_9ACTN|nr:lipase chaperone [Streptomyces flavochromogenes]
MKKYWPAAAGVVAAVAIAAPSAVGAPTETSTISTISATSATSVATGTAARTEPAEVTPAKAAVPAPNPVRTVRPGERVDAGRGFTVWLTRDGKHWTGPDGYENFRSVVDGNIDRSEPGVSHQSEGDGTGVFHSGLYYGTRKAGRVELSDTEGHKTVATLIALPGRPDWGVWYAHTGPADGNGGSSLGVTLYDRTGRLLAELPGFDFPAGRG